MDLKNLRALATIADAGSFNAAAERLHLTPSAVTMQIKALESELEQALFDRSVRPPALTRAGRAVLAHAREMLSLDARMRAEVSAGTELSGTLVLGVVPSVTTGVLPGVLARLNRLYPRLQLRVETGLSADLSRRVAQGELDAAVVTQSAPLDAGLIGQVVLTEALAVVTHVDEPGADAASLLAELPFIRFNRMTGIGQIIDRALAERGISVRESMELDSIEAMLLMAAYRLGVTIVPERSVTNAMRPALKVQPFGSPPVERRVVLVTRRSSSQERYGRALYEQLRAEVV
ncbi:MAG: LysR substrate-binding domain-containing protein [Gammaproteobacteria bacterium]